jgi:hypothetical protein
MGSIWMISNPGEWRIDNQVFINVPQETHGVALNLELGANVLGRSCLRKPVDILIFPDFLASCLYSPEWHSRSLLDPKISAWTGHRIWRWPLSRAMQRTGSKTQSCRADQFVSLPGRATINKVLAYARRLTRSRARRRSTPRFSRPESTNRCARPNANNATICASAKVQPVETFTRRLPPPTCRE